MQFLPVVGEVVENEQEVENGKFFLTVDLGTTSVKLIWWSEKGEKVGEDSFPVELSFSF